jgi:signal transduction histidine kinase
MNVDFNRLLGRRSWPIRLILPLSGLGYLFLLQKGPLSLVDWACMLITLVLSLLGGRLPLTVVVGESIALVLAHRYGTATPVVIKVGASMAIFELTMRRYGRPAVAGAGVLVTAYVIDRVATLPQAFYSAAVVVAGPMLIAAYIRSLQREARIALERAEEADHRRDLAERAIRMAERTAIARELHDMVAHHMASLALRVGVARHVMADLDPRVCEVLDDVHAGATSALVDLRRLLTALRTQGEPGQAMAAATELPAAVHALIESARSNGLTVEEKIGPELSGLDAVRGLTVLRLVQEGLTNVAKHAGPDTAVRISTAVDAKGELLVDVSNDPGRTRPPAALAGAGHGLLGMRERVELVGGRLEAGPTSGGWRLAAALPATEPA